jgi:CRP-like cAMP-binding protein
MSFYHTKYSKTEIQKLLKVGARHTPRPINSESEETAAELSRENAENTLYALDAARRKLIESRSKIYLFDNLKPDEISAVVKNARLLSFEAGDKLFARGDRGKEIFFLLSGGADIFAVLPDGQNKLIAKASAGDLIGLTAFVGRKPREISCLCASDDTTAISFEIDEAALNETIPIATPFLRLYINITTALSKQLALDSF